MAAREWRPELLEANAARWVISDNPRSHNRANAKQHFAYRGMAYWEAACGLRFALVIEAEQSELAKCSGCLEMIA